jgi:hypothetical protein
MSSYVSVNVASIDCYPSNELLGLWTNVVCETHQRGSHIDFSEYFNVIRGFSDFVKSLYPDQI